MTNLASIPGIVKVEATEVSSPPVWALKQRNLIGLMERAAPMMMEKYYERGGAPTYADDVDDLYERCHNWGLFYAIGAHERVLDLALQNWNAVTRWFDDDYVSRVHTEFKPQIHNEYYNLAVSHGAEWHHKGEGNVAFYDFGLANPTMSENVRRARKFAAMYMGEDPEAPNYDPRYKVLRSPMQSSQGPQLHADVDEVKFWLQGGHPAKYPERWVPKRMGVRASLYPVVKELEDHWYRDPRRRDEIVETFERVVLNGDIANNLCATALVANAYLYTRDAKYKQWVLDYVDAWIDRTKHNGGIIPDNVGPTGKVGEQREGQFWGGLYGWNHYRGYGNLFHAVNIATECAHLLSGDESYLDLMRSQIEVLLDNSVTRDDGHLLVPTRYGPGGWQYTEDMRHTQPGLLPLRMEELAHLYHGSLSKGDYELIARVRAGDVMNDWNDVPVTGEKNSGETERARFQYYDGQNPDWPEKILDADYQNVSNTFERIKNEDRDAQSLIEANVMPPNPVYTKGLTQVTMGAPQSIYNGGILRATVRYFDPDYTKPGLPRDVAALVDELKSDRAGVRLVNLSRYDTRNVIVQAGAFGEHQFTKVRHGDGEEGTTIPLDSKYLAVQLPPSTAIRLDVGMRRFVNDPSYAFPWHGDEIPVPFQ